MKRCGRIRFLFLIFTVLLCSQTKFVLADTLPVVTVDEIDPAEGVLGTVEGVYTSPDGFAVRGTARDAQGQAVSKVEVNVCRLVVISSPYTRYMCTGYEEADYNASTQAWEYQVSADPKDAGHYADIYVVATDAAGQKNLMELAVVQVADQWPIDRDYPRVKITSVDPFDQEGGNIIPTTGFTIEGTVSDSQGIDTFTAEFCQKRASYIPNPTCYTIEPSTYDEQTGEAQFEVLPEIILLGKTAWIRLVAKDTAGKTMSTPYLTAMPSSTWPPTVEYPQFSFEAVGNGELSEYATTPLDTYKPDSASPEGLRIYGKASSANGIDKVLITVQYPKKIYIGGYWGYTSYPFTSVRNEEAVYDPLTEEWYYDIAAEDISPDATATIYARAIDNQAISSISMKYLVGVEPVWPVDREKPGIIITKPVNWDPTPETGFVITGQAVDDTGVQSVSVRVEYRKAVAIGTIPVILTSGFAEYDAETQTWRFNVDPFEDLVLTPGTFLKIAVTARDSVGNYTPTKGYSLVSEGDQETWSYSSVEGTQMVVRKRSIEDGTLEPPVAWKLKGVNYSPVPVGETVEVGEWTYPHYRDLMNEQNLYEVDFKKMEEMGVNTIRTYVDFGFEIGPDGTAQLDTKAREILDEAYDKGIMVMLHVRTHDIDVCTNQPVFADEVINVVNAYKDHPALLAWVIGNEWNINMDLYNPKPFWCYDGLADAAVAINETARQIKELDPNHVVVSSLGVNPYDVIREPDLFSDPTYSYAQIFEDIPNVDIWGINIYQNDRFDPFFLQWREFDAGKPFIFTEFGIDSFRTDDWRNGPLPGSEDEDMQRDAMMNLWDEIHRNLSANDPANQCVGGFIFQWADGWWKADNPPVGPTGNAWQQDPGGFPRLIQVANAFDPSSPYTFLGQPDGFSNEEYFGIMKMDSNSSRSEKLVFAALRDDGFSLGWLRPDPFALKVESVSGSYSYRASFFKHGQPVRLGARGFNAVVMDRATGAVKEMRRFDTYAEVSTACPAMKSFVDDVCDSNASIDDPAGRDILMMGIADTGTPYAFSTGYAPMADCKAALDRLGSEYSGSIYFRQPWSMIVTPGDTPVVLDEQIGPANSVSAVSSEVEVYLNADRDAQTDETDPDDDNDGVSDTQERSQGTDVLDPNDQ